jgi:hypothetical protein
MSRSRAGKLEAAQHHNKNVARREEEMYQEENFSGCFYSRNPQCLL